MGGRHVCAGNPGWADHRAGRAVFGQRVPECGGDADPRNNPFTISLAVGVPLRLSVHLTIGLTLGFADSFAVGLAKRVTL